MFDEATQIIQLVEQYPELLDVYRDISEFRKKPEEVIGMFSEALRIMDRNTTKYMVEDIQRQRDEAVERLDKAVEKLDEAVEQRDEAVERLDEAYAEIERLKKQLEELTAK